MKHLCITIALIATFLGCSPKEKQIIISTNTWIGYSPLFYAKEVGWLEEINIDIINFVSLGESMYTYEVGSSDAFTGTQYEYSVMRSKSENLIPVIIFDRSHGGDMVMSNKSLETIKSDSETIDVYLELGSINKLVLAAFIKLHSIDKDRLNLINKDQGYIASLNNNMKQDVLIVTYSPYNIKLSQEGFIEIGSTKTNDSIVVIDALFMESEIAKINRYKLKKLYTYVNEAIQISKNNPKEYYKKVYPYLDYPSYEDFTEMLNKIEWINEVNVLESKEVLKEAPLLLQEGL